MSGNGQGMAEGKPTKVTLSSLAKMAREGRAFACLTCYDATTARWLAAAGVHVLLVGDTAAEMVLGFERTVDMPMEVLIHLTAGVKRGAPGAVVMADMPFMSYHAGTDDAVRNAGRFLVEGRADIVKLEADETFAGVVERMVRAGVPVCGHVGSRPQRAAVTSGYTSAGRTEGAIKQLVADAVALEQAGCSQLLIEAVPEAATAAVLAATKVPVIGIGAGPAPHGQVMVLQDLLGLTERPPAFVHPMASMGAELKRVGQEWVDRVGRRAVGASPYGLKSAGGTGAAGAGAVGSEGAG